MSSFPSPTESQSIETLDKNESIDRGAQQSNGGHPPSTAAAGEAVEKREKGEGEEEEEEEGETECGFCLFMKSGGCKDPFVAWEKCVEEAEKTGEDVVDKCFEVTSLLKKCMDAHADYYSPILRAEEAVAEAAAEAAAAAESSNAESSAAKPENQGPKETKVEIVVVENEPENNQN